MLKLNAIPCKINFFKGIFCKKGYPENFIDKCFKNLLSNIYLVTENVRRMEKNVCS